MRRLTAIILLLIVVFNFYGYQLVISYLQQSNTAAIEANIEKEQYNEAELISIKTTLNLPYYTSSPQFERAYGSITIEGIVYEYVKRRIYNDTLELLCLPNHRQSALNEVSSEMAKGAADGASLPAKKNSNLKLSLPDYFQEISTGLTPLFTTTTKKLPLLPSTTTLMGYCLQPDRPPQINTVPRNFYCI